MEVILLIVLKTKRGGELGKTKRKKGCICTACVEEAHQLFLDQDGICYLERAEGVGEGETSLIPLNWSTRVQGNAAKGERG